MGWDTAPSAFGLDMDLIFEGDYNKGEENAKKHRVTFEEAVTVFSDALSFTTEDVSHSIDEDKYLTIGVSSRQRVLSVIYTERGNRIRIISARLPTAHERKAYEEGT